MRRRDWGTKLCLRGRERVERPDADLRGTDSHRRQSGHFASIGAELHIVVEILGFVPLLDKHEVVGIEIAPEQPDVSEALVKPGLWKHASKSFDERVGEFRLDNPGYGDGDGWGMLTSSHHVESVGSKRLARNLEASHWQIALSV